LTTTQQQKPSKAQGKTAVLTGALAVIGCMLACSLPLLAAGGALAGLGAMLAGWWPAAAVALAAAAAVTFVYLRRRGGRNTGMNTTGCDCGGNC
jgi:membrane protein implicated in regulation of membrane protease activity